MQITLLYFQMVRKCTEMETETISVEAGCTVGALISHLQQRHPGLRDMTAGLLIAVNDIIPESGRAVIAYIFGYETKKLIQINIIWSSDGDTLASAESLVATGNILRNYFVAQGFPPEGLLTNQRLNDGSIIMFRGVDDKGRAAVLQLTIEPGVTAEDGTAGDSKVTALNLSYIADPVAPDIFKINQGDF